MFLAMISTVRLKKIILKKSTVTYKPGRDGVEDCLGVDNQGHPDRGPQSGICKG